MYMSRGEQLLVILLLLLLVCRELIFGIEYDGPSGRERRMRVDIARFEKEAAKDGRDAEILAVGQMDDIDRRHDDVGGVARLSYRKDGARS
jgi:hypothetical protein